MGEIAVTETGTEQERFLTARVAGLDVAFPALEVGAAAALGPLTPVPRSLLGIAGVAAVGDRIATVVDLARCLGGETAGAAGISMHWRSTPWAMSARCRAVGFGRSIPGWKMRWRGSRPARFNATDSLSSFWR